MSLKEQEQIERVTKALTDADSLVWNSLGYPNSERPDVGFLASNIKIGDHPSSFALHPKIKPELLRQAERRSQRIKTGKGSVFWYDSVTRGLVVGRGSFKFQDERLRCFTWNHAARDLSSRAEDIQPSRYPDDLLDWADQMLKFAFSFKDRPALDDTRILKTGFRRSLFVGKYLVSHLLQSEDHLNEIYPTTLEIVTEQTMLRRGVYMFDHDIAVGRVTPNLREEEHPKFVSTLLQLLPIIDWRDILAAFRTGNTDETVEHLEQTAKTPNLGRRIYSVLLHAMEIDETTLIGTNTALADAMRPQFRINLN